MGQYQIATSQWEYFDTPTKIKSGDVTHATVEPDTQGGTSTPNIAPAATIDAHVDAAGPDKSSSGQAETSVSCRVTYTWQADPASPNEAPIPKASSITIQGNPLYSIAANAQFGTAEAEARATARISGGSSFSSTTIYDDIEHASSSSRSAGGPVGAGIPAPLKVSSFTVTANNETYTVSVDVWASASRNGEASSAHADASITNITVYPT